MVLLKRMVAKKGIEKEEERVTILKEVDVEMRWSLNEVVFRRS